MAIRGGPDFTKTVFGCGSHQGLGTRVLVWLRAGNNRDYGRRGNRRAAAVVSPGGVCAALPAQGRFDLTGGRHESVIDARAWHREFDDARGCGGSVTLAEVDAEAFMHCLANVGWDLRTPEVVHGVVVVGVQDP